MRTWLLPLFCEEAVIKRPFAAPFSFEVIGGTYGVDWLLFTNLLFLFGAGVELLPTSPTFVEEKVVPILPLSPMF